MKHQMSQRKLGRTAKHRMAMLKNLAISVFLYEKVDTTEPKSKEVRKIVETLITKAKDNSLHSRRQIMSYLSNNEIATKKIFEVLVPRFQNRPGGYTRLVKTGFRDGDNAPTAQLSLITDEK